MEQKSDSIKFPKYIVGVLIRADNAAKKTDVAKGTFGNSGLPVGDAAKNDDAVSIESSQNSKKMESEKFHFRGRTEPRGPDTALS
jgi:hypothetical protein